MGASTLTHLLTTNAFTLTIITRSDSTSTFPSHPSLTVKRGSYSDGPFLAEAFKGQDAAIFALGFMAMNEQKLLIDAAAKAAVKWILPAEYGPDGLNKVLMDGVPLYWDKVAARKQIEELAANEKGCEGLKWVGVATNPWAEFSLVRGMFGFQIPQRKVVMYEDAGRFNTSTLEQVGKGIARLLSLPISNPEDSRRSLGYYANNFVYISSLHTTQAELFEAAQRATGTTEADWTIERSSIMGPGGRIAKAKEAFEKGDMMGGADLAYCYYMGEGKGGDFEAKAKEDREVLGLEMEDVDRVVENAVKGLGAGTGY